MAVNYEVGYVRITAEFWEPKDNKVSLCRNGN